MISARRVFLLALSAMLSLPPLDGALADQSIKPVITGLVSTGITLKEFTGSAQDIKKKIPTLFLSEDEKTDLTGLFGGLVIQISWATLEPAAPGARGVALNTQLLDAALEAVDTYNAKARNLPPPNNRKIGVRLRVYAGCNNAPGWVTTTYGSLEIDANYNKNPEKCMIGTFWDHSSMYSVAWQKFQAALAAKYDSDQRIQEVAVTSCTSFSAEPFFLPYENAQDNTANVLKTTKYKYTAAKYQDCLEQAVPVDYAPWKTTRLEFSFNAFNGVVLSPPNDVAFSARVMRICRQAAGERCILSNHDLGAVPPSASTVLPIYALERKFGPHLTYQTYVKKPADYEGTIRKGVSLGADAIEVWADGYKLRPVETLESWAAMFGPQ
jgi:hypothetical protein